MNNKEYQKNELIRFQKQNARFFDTVKEFDASLLDMDVDEQIAWIENGSYGAGACLELQRVLNSLTKRMNARANIGNVVLKALYGADFRYFKKLSPEVQDKMNKAIDLWLTKEHEFAMILDI